MLTAMLVVALLQDTTSGDEVVVTASRRRCSMQIADQLLSDREFNRRAREWAAGRPVRIVMDEATDYRCMAEIMFRLQKRGVTRAEFVDSAKTGTAPR